jgi:hypothetical protein
MNKVEVTVGSVFGNLTVIGEDEAKPESGKRPRVRFLCQCTCGKKVSVETYKLRTKTKSCGCDRKSRLTHGASNRGDLTYSSWLSMRRRCSEKTHKDFEKYSKLGYEPRWDDYLEFVKDVGERPSKDHTLDRIQNSVGYFLNNVRWATWTEQQRNRTNNRLIVHNGVAVTLGEAAEIAGLTRATLQQRLSKYKKPIAESLGTGFYWPNGVNPYTGKLDNGLPHS